eukprot:5581870-Amphidinium_carterae.1
MASPFLLDAATWLASHLIDYSLVPSNIHVYLNSILELAQHPTIKNLFLPQHIQQVHQILAHDA